LLQGDHATADAPRGGVGGVEHRGERRGVSPPVLGPALEDAGWRLLDEVAGQGVKLAGEVERTFSGEGEQADLRSVERKKVLEGSRSLPSVMLIDRAPLV